MVFSFALIDSQAPTRAVPAIHDDFIIRPKFPNPDDIDSPFHPHQFDLISQLSWPPFQCPLQNFPYMDGFSHRSASNGGSLHSRPALHWWYSTSGLHANLILSRPDAKSPEGRSLSLRSFHFSTAVRARQRFPHDARLGTTLLSPNLHVQIRSAVYGVERPSFFEVLGRRLSSELTYQTACIAYCSRR